MEILKCLNERELDVLRESFQRHSMHSLNEDEFVCAIEGVCVNKTFPFKLTRRYLTTLFANADVTGSSRLSWDAFSMFVIQAALNATATNVTINADTNTQAEHANEQDGIHMGSKKFRETLEHEYANRYSNNYNALTTTNGVNANSDRKYSKGENIYLPTLAKGKSANAKLNEIKAPTVLPISNKILHRTLSFSPHARRSSRRASQTFMESGNFDNNNNNNNNNNINNVAGNANFVDSNCLVASPRANEKWDSKVDHVLLQSIRSRRVSYQEVENKDEFVFDVDESKTHEGVYTVGLHNYNSRESNCKVAKDGAAYSNLLDHKGVTQGTSYNAFDDGKSNVNNDKEYDLSRASSICSSCVAAGEAGAAEMKSNTSKIGSEDEAQMAETRDETTCSIHNKSNKSNHSRHKMIETEETDEFTSFRPYHVAGCSPHS